jgi:hypothetical protein
MSNDGAAIAAAGKRILALALLAGALTLLALLLGAGSANASEKSPGHGLGAALRNGHHHLSGNTHVTTPAAHSRANRVRHSARHAVGQKAPHPIRQVAGPRPVRSALASLSAPSSSTPPRSQPSGRPTSAPARGAIADVRSSKPGRPVRDAVLFVKKTTSDVRHTAQQLTDQLVPSVLPPDLPGTPAPTLPGPGSTHPAAGSPSSHGSGASTATHREAADHAAAPVSGADSITPATIDSSSTAGITALIGTAVSAMRDLPALPMPLSPRTGDNEAGTSSSVALFAGMLGAALLLALMSGLARLRSRRFRLVPNPTYRPGSSPD